MDYRSFSQEDFHQFYLNTKTHTQNTYGITVLELDLEPPKTAEFNGRSISLDNNLVPEKKLYMLVHLFGHTIQWSRSEKQRNIGLRQPGFSDFEPYRKLLIKELDQICYYEKEACIYGLRLMEEAGISTLQQWISDWFNADWSYLKRIYTSGLKAEYADNFKAQYYKFGTTLIPSKKIPIYTPVEWPPSYTF